jgi:hypothetical protein
LAFYEPDGGNNNQMTPYAAFPTMLLEEHRGFGLAWWLAMMHGAKMQGPFGASYACSTNG